MPFTDACRARLAAALATVLGCLAACAPARPLPPPAAPAAVPGAKAGSGSAAIGVAPESQGRARDWDAYRLQVAYRLVRANPSGTYLGRVPEPLLAIPVLEIELNADGSVRHITVKRMPTQAHDTVQLAIDAVRRAAPFADVSHLPRPWKFSQVFLFDDERRFKPRELDLE